MAGVQKLIEKKLANFQKKILKELFCKTFLRVHANYYADWGIPGRFTAPQVADWVLDDVGPHHSYRIRKNGETIE